MKEVGNSNFISAFQSYMIIEKKLFHMMNQLNIIAIVGSYKMILIENYWKWKKYSEIKWANISDIYLFFISLF